MTVLEGALWGAHAADWSELYEPHAEPLFEAALAKCRVGRGMDFVDIGCGSGRAAQMAAERGARIAGLDASADMIEIARRRTPAGDFRIGDMQQLPWRARSFDVVTYFNSLQYATSPVDALREGAQVMRPQGRMAVAAWAEPERCDGAEYVAALHSLAVSQDTSGSWRFSDPMTLRTLIESAGLETFAMREVQCSAIYRDADTAVRALSAGAAAARAIDAAGEAKVRDTILASIAPFRRYDGSYRTNDVFRLAIAEF